jgi:Spy/CpxP family protein refolding chaperone
MKAIRFRLLIAALAVLMGTTIAKSQTITPDSAPPPPPMHPHGMDMGMGWGEHLKFLSDKLNLTDEQKTQMHSLMQQARPAMKPLMQQQHQIDEQLRQYVEGNFDQAKVQALAQQKSQVQAQITVEEARVHSQIYQLLTADQKTQLKQMEAEHEQRMQQHQPPPEE